MSNQVDHPTELTRMLKNLTESDSYQYMCKALEENTRLKGDIQKVKEVNEFNDDKIIDLKQTLAALRSESLQKDEELARQREEKADLDAELDKKKKELEENAKSIYSLGVDLKQRDIEIAKLKMALQKEQQKSRDRDDLARQLNSLTRDLANRDQRLQRLESFSLKLNSLSKQDVDIPTQLSNLFSSALRLAERYFSIDFPKETLGSPSLWKELKEKNRALAYPDPIPLPLKNSPTANKMRTAAFLHLLSSELASHIFQPVYFLHQEGQHELGGVLSSLAAADAEMETYLRSVMLKTVSSMEQMEQLSSLRSPAEMVRLRVDTVVNNVLACVGDLTACVPDQKRKDRGFRTELQGLCERAAEMWRLYVQRVKEKVEPSFKLAWGEERCWLPLSEVMETPGPVPTLAAAVRTAATGSGGGSANPHNSLIPKSQVKGSGTGGKNNGARSTKKENLPLSSRNARVVGDGSQHPNTNTTGVSSSPNTNLTDIAAVVWPFFFVNDLAPEEGEEDYEDDEHEQQVVLLAQGYVLTKAEIMAGKEEESQLLILGTRHGARKSQRRSRGDSLSVASVSVAVDGPSMSVNGAAGPSGSVGEEGGINKKGFQNGEGRSRAG